MPVLATLSVTSATSPSRPSHDTPKRRIRTRSSGQGSAGVLHELLTGHECPGEEGQGQADQELAPQPSQWSGPVRSRPGHQCPGPRLDQTLRSHLSLRVVFHRKAHRTSTWSDGPCISSSDCEGSLSWHGTGCVRNNNASPGSPATGPFSQPLPIDLQEPDELRGSRPVL